MSNIGLFLKQMWRNPKEVSAIAPSSKTLAKRMAASIPAAQGTVIELGAGTGIVTRAVLDTGLAPSSLYSFEINEEFIDFLTPSFPRVNFVADWAQNLGRHGIEDVKAVISGLPLLSMDIATQRAIVGAVFDALRPGGVYIQFTYGLSPSIDASLIEEFGLGWTRSSRVWGNLPPATSYTFYRKSDKR